MILTRIIVFSISYGGDRKDILYTLKGKMDKHESKFKTKRQKIQGRNLKKGVEGRAGLCKAELAH